MKVLYLVSGVGPKAAWGTEFIQELIFSLGKKGIKVTIITPIYRNTPSSWKDWVRSQSKRNNLRIITLETPKIIRDHLLLHFLITPFITTLAAFRLLKREQFDIIHEFSSIPVILLRSAFLKKIFKTKIIFSLSVLNTGFFGKLNWVRLFNFADMYLIPSPEIIKNLKKLGINSNKIMLIPPGLELTKFYKKKNLISARKKLSLPLNRFIISYYGPLTTEKGVTDIINSIKLINTNLFNKPIFIFWVGRKSEKEHDKILTMIKTQNYQNVLLKEGLVNIPILLMASNIILLPQRTGNGTTIPPVSTIEALASGKRVIATNIIGNRDFKNLSNLILTKPSNPKLLAEIISKEIRVKEKTAYNLNELKLYNLQNSIKSHLNLYRQIHA